STYFQFQMKVRTISEDVINIFSIKYYSIRQNHLCSQHKKALVLVKIEFTVVAFQNIVHDWSRRLIVNINLFRILIKNAIKSKALRRFVSVVRVPHSYSSFDRVDLKKADNLYFYNS